MDSKKLITVKEFAMEYGIGTNKAYEMVNSKGFPVVKLGRKILVIRDRVDEFLYKNIGVTF
ncbi:helix-turn-helix domain-containing protein [Romboutsia lituseburensis]|uniref:helix-turn-helix domain-containing protein n=1 Tax=Romboutsia lituseburensis TaxID=1537 RepID=UPI00215AD479|nr:helix-turn-helix domain-containing protein [Romboutsia lituseburensis]MCR8746213.1 helix-turn-helix domain-containing protein [Romboutsia lituseburensis]